MKHETQPHHTTDPERLQDDDRDRSISLGHSQ
jgi:hypothetical protein